MFCSLVAVFQNRKQLLKLSRCGQHTMCVSGGLSLTKEWLARAPKGPHRAFWVLIFEGEDEGQVQRTRIYIIYINYVYCS